MPTVKSPAADQVRLDYDPDTQRLSVTFEDGGETFTYRRVPHTVYDAFARATSKHRFFAVHIRPRYPRA
jgi:YD repeat-containing protein